MNAQAPATSSDLPAPRDPRTKKQEETQKGILSAATSVFAEVGYEAARIADIAAGAKVAKGTVLYHFHSKEILWKLVFEDAVRQFEGNFGLPSSIRSPNDLLDRLRSFMRACQLSPTYLRMTALESMSDNWRSRWIGQRYLARSLQTVQAAVETAELGKVSSLDPLVLQSILAGGYEHVLGQAAMIKAATGRDVTANAFVKVYLENLGMLISGEALASRI